MFALAGMQCIFDIKVKRSSSCDKKTQISKTFGFFDARVDTTFLIKNLAHLLNSNKQCIIIIVWLETLAWIEWQLLITL